jgi:hypothetical protein
VILSAGGIVFRHTRSGAALLFLGGVLLGQSLMELCQCAQRLRRFA